MDKNVNRIQSARFIERRKLVISISHGVCVPTRSYVSEDEEGNESSSYERVFFWRWDEVVVSALPGSLLGACLLRSQNSPKLATPQLRRRRTSKRVCGSCGEPNNRQMPLVQNRRRTKLARAKLTARLRRGWLRSKQNKRSPLFSLHDVGTGEEVLLHARRLNDVFCLCWMDPKSKPTVRSSTDSH